jgi:hypothetical protein
MVAAPNVDAQRVARACVCISGGRWEGEVEDDACIGRVCEEGHGEDVDA